MARIAGVDLPREKKVEIGLTYIFGIGRATAQQILEKTGVDADAARPRSERRGREQAPPGDREGVPRRGRAPHRGRDEHQATDGHRLVPRHPSSPRASRSRSADAHERPHQEGTAPRDRRQEEGNQVDVWLLGRRQSASIEAEGIAHVNATFNNTTITITDPHGNTIVLGIVGQGRLQGLEEVARPFAATVAAEQAAREAVTLGVSRVHVRVQGPG